MALAVLTQGNSALQKSFQVKINLKI